MHVLNGHFEGRKLVLDDPIPDDLPSNARVRITVEPPSDESAFDKIAAMAVDTDLPADYSVQHEHYVKGAPKR